MSTPLYLVVTTQYTERWEKINAFSTKEAAEAFYRAHIEEVRQRHGDYDLALILGTLDDENATPFGEGDDDE